jgi:hypothetical protein
VIDAIENLPDSINNYADADKVVKAWVAYETLTDVEKEQIPQVLRVKLEGATKQAKEVNHIWTDASGNVITISGDGFPWYVRVTQVYPTDERFTELVVKLSGRKLIVLYDIELHDTLTDKPYTLSGGETVTVSIRILDSDVDLSKEKNVAIVHEKKDGGIEYIAPIINGNTVEFKASGFSLYGVVTDEDANTNATPIPTSTKKPTLKSDPTDTNEPADKSDIPKTGDNYNLTLWMWTFAVATFGCGTMIIKWSRRYRRNTG